MITVRDMDRPCPSCVFMYVLLKALLISALFPILSEQVLKHAQQVDMMSEYHNYFITSLDAHTIDTEDFQYGGTNISAFRLIDFSSKEIDDVARDWIQRRHRFSSKKSSSTPSSFNTGAQDFYKVSIQRDSILRSVACYSVCAAPAALFALCTPPVVLPG